MNAKRIAIFCIVTLTCSVGFGQIEKDSINEQMALDAGSLFEAFVGNAAGWERGDVLLKMVRSIDSSDAPTKSGIFLVKETVTYHRIVFDHPNQRYFYAYSGSAKKVVFNDPNSESEAVESAKKTVKGFLVDDNKKIARIFPNRPAKLRKGVTAKQLIKQFGMPDLRTVGGSTFGSKIELEQFVKAMNLNVSGEGISKIKNVSPTEQDITFRFINPRNPTNVSDIEYRMDTEMFVPKRQTIFIVDPESSSRTLWSKEDFKWKVMGGIPVPSSVTREYNSQEMISNERCLFKTYLDAEFHWFSLNDDLDETNFDPDNLSDINRFMKLLDPVATNADGITSSNNGFGDSKTD